MESLYLNNHMIYCEEIQSILTGERKSREKLDTEVKIEIHIGFMRPIFRRKIVTYLEKFHPFIAYIYISFFFYYTI